MTAHLPQNSWLSLFTQGRSAIQDCQLFIFHFQFHVQVCQPLISHFPSFTFEDVVGPVLYIHPSPHNQQATLGIYSIQLGIQFIMRKDADRGVVIDCASRNLLVGHFY